MLRLGPRLGLRDERAIHRQGEEYLHVVTSPTQDPERAPTANGRRQAPLGAALLMFELHDMRAVMALRRSRAGRGALGLGAMWPALARIEAIAALLLLPPLAVVLALRLDPRRARLATSRGTGNRSRLGARRPRTAIAIVRPAGPFESFWLRADAPSRPWIRLRRQAGHDDRSEEPCRETAVPSCSESAGAER